MECVALCPRNRNVDGLSVQVRAVGAAGGRAGREPVGLRALRAAPAQPVAPPAARRAALHARARAQRAGARLPLHQAVRAHQEQPVQEDEAGVAQQRLPRQVKPHPAPPHPAPPPAPARPAHVPADVFLRRSKIQGLGLYAARDLEKHTMVIEYIGEIIRSELSEIREKQYEAKVSD